MSTLEARLTAFATRYVANLMTLEYDGFAWRMTWCRRYSNGSTSPVRTVCDTELERLVQQAEAWERSVVET